MNLWDELVIHIAEVMQSGLNYTVVHGVVTTIVYTSQLIGNALCQR